MRKAVRIIAGIAAGFLALVAGLLIFVWGSTYHPAEEQKESFYNSEKAPVLKKGQPLKVLSWNVQFMAGKNKVFFFDTAKGDGPDIRPSKEDIARTLHEVARVIKEENPDVVLLQELDVNAKRTDYEDQLARLRALLPSEYSCYASSWYWKAAFVPHPKIMGRAGMKVAVISKYKIKEATRYQLPIMPDNIIMQQLNFKRAILETVLQSEDGGVSVMSTHFDAFAQGNDTMERQVAFIQKLMRKRTAEGRPWIAGGDFNLMAPGSAYNDIAPSHKIFFNEKSELEPLMNEFQSVPSIGDIYGHDAAKWISHWPNDPDVKKPDRTIDFIFASSSVNVAEKHIRQGDALTISDHFPVIAVFNLPK